MTKKTPKDGKSPEFQSLGSWAGTLNRYLFRAIFSSGYFIFSFLSGFFFPLSVSLRTKPRTVIPVQSSGSELRTSENPVTMIGIATSKSSLCCEEGPNVRGK